MAAKASTSPVLSPEQWNIYLCYQIAIQIAAINYVQLSKYMPFWYVLMASIDQLVARPALAALAALRREHRATWAPKLPANRENLHTQHRMLPTNLPGGSENSATPGRTHLRCPCDSRWLKGYAFRHGRSLGQLEVASVITVIALMANP